MPLLKGHNAICSQDISKIITARSFNQLKDDNE